MKPYVISTSTSPYRLPEEPNLAYTQFCVYRDMGPTRSLDLAWQAWRLHVGKKFYSGKHPGCWSRKCQQYNWVERAEEYDEEMRENKREALQAQREQDFADDLQLMRQQKQRDRELTDAMHTSLLKGLNAPFMEVTHEKCDDATGLKTTTKSKNPTFSGMNALNEGYLKTSARAVRGIDVKEAEKEERKVDRVVWVKAPKLPVEPNPLPDKSDKPDKPDSGSPQLITGPSPVSEPGELFDPLPSDPRPYDEEEAA